MTRVPMFPALVHLLVALALCTAIFLLTFLLLAPVVELKIERAFAPQSLVSPDGWSWNDD